MKWQKKGQLELIMYQYFTGWVGDALPVGDVLWNLDYDLQLREAVIDCDQDDNSTNIIGELRLRLYD
ncbi:hypothetical protein F2Q69_00019285 [Brassica cretica]|uniref:Uncharacterized protein n=1 Tax=Brassica cretica TaxID=69181 RepID=A0A8S9QIU4_BRACR|nr:hypothetical protein F2Q69_00019285 [Brassica cretica]